jgi:hypothetical protein
MTDQLSLFDLDRRDHTVPCVGCGVSLPTPYFPGMYGVECVERNHRHVLDFRILYAKCGRPGRGKRPGSYG